MEEEMSKRLIPTTKNLTPMTDKILLITKHASFVCGLVHYEGHFQIVYEDSKWHAEQVAALEKYKKMGHSMILTLRYTTYEEAIDSLLKIIVGRGRRRVRK